MEFEIAFTVADLDLEAAFPRRYDGLLSPAELSSYRRKLIDLTRGLLDLSPAGTLASALSRIDILAEIQAKRNVLLPPPVSAADALYRVKLLLEECHELGTVPFAIAARHAFVAEALLRSSVRVGALSEHRVWELKQSVPTVTGQLYGDFREALRAEDERQRFLIRYGHLRPGTYDILSLRYDQRSDLFDASSLPDPIGPNPRFVPTAAERRALEKALAVAELDVLDAGGLIDYARRAIQARERAKLIFTRHLSDALELLAVFGEKVELSREDVSFLELEPLLTGLERVCPGGLSGHARGISEKGRDAMETAASLHLGYLVRDVRDIFVIPLHRGAPNFVTDRKIEGETAYVSSRTLGHSDLSGRVVCIESADPGFDWIFTRGISGLITKFGGANSHMAIRCAEFGLPAAVGCGEQTFERLVAAGRAELDQRARVLRPLYG
ncbi:MAG: hypothetical protein IPL90_15390 [Holophagales bacterium]|nr:hypothetical protein [Holophagales bacterium]